MSDLFPDLKIVEPPSELAIGPAPIDGEQCEMFETWQKLGLPGLFEPAAIGDQT